MRSLDGANHEVNQFVLDAVSRSLIHIYCLVKPDNIPGHSNSVTAAASVQMKSARRLKIYNRYTFSFECDFCGFTDSRFTVPILEMRFHSKFFFFFEFYHRIYYLIPPFCCSFITAYV